MLHAHSTIATSSPHLLHQIPLRLSGQWVEEEQTTARLQTTLPISQPEVLTPSQGDSDVQTGALDVHVPQDATQKSEQFASTAFGIGFHGEGGEEEITREAGESPTET